MLDRGHGRALCLIGLALFSGSLLFVEIGLTRLFATLYYPPVVFSVLSLAVLGVGLGAALAAWQTRWRQVQYTGAYMAMASLAVLLLATAVFVALPVVPHALLFLLAPLPFLFAGLALASLFSDRPAQSPQLYMADLAGAGLGALLVVPALNWLGVPNGLIAGSLMAFVASIPFASRRGVWAPVLAGLVGATALVVSVATGWYGLDMRSLPVEKPISAALGTGGRTLQTSWDAFARTDLIDPGGGLPYEIYMDGAAGSIMPPEGGYEALWRDIGFFPFATEQPAQVFVIGPGGGLDIWFALQANAKHVAAVEVNAASVDMVRELAEYNGDLNGNPAVRVLVDEGRSVLEREASEYDLIFLSQVVTLAAERDGYTLVENTAYTIEAFETYLAHLYPDGQIALKLYDEATLTRALATAVAALNRQGLSDGEALQHVVALLDANVEPPVPLLMVRKTPYGEDDALSIGAVAREVGFTPLFLPGVWAEPPLDGVVDGVLSLNDVIATADSDLTPTTDDRPFFFQFEKGVPAALRPLLMIMAFVVGTGTLLLVWSQRGAGARTRYAYAGYFALLGMGFMMAEITMIQQARLFLGHPTYAVAVVLAVLLIGGGIGSGLVGWQQRIRADARPLPWWPPFGVVVSLGIWLLVWPQLQITFRSLELEGRLLVVVIALLPAALFLGTPFPLGLRAVGLFGNQQVALGWAINGVMSVAGSVAAVALALLAGYDVVLVCAVLAYIGVLSLTVGIDRSRLRASQP